MDVYKDIHLNFNIIRLRFIITLYSSNFTKPHKLESHKKIELLIIYSNHLNSNHYFQQVFLEEFHYCKVFSSRERLLIYYI